MHMRSTTGFYGAEKVIYNLFDNFTANDLSLSLITLETPEESSKILRKRIPMSYNVHGYTLIKKYDRDTIQLIKEQLVLQKIKILHTHDYKSLFYSILASSALKISLIHHMHGYLNNTFIERLYSLLEKYLITKVNLVFVVSETLKKNLQNSFFLKNTTLTYLSNGTTLPEQPQQKIIHKSDTVKVSLIARFTAEKNHLLALKVAKVLLANNYKFTLKLYGDGPLKYSIQQQIINMGLQGHVFIAGYYEDMSEVYHSTDILLITSFTEGLPMVLLEAMSYQIPIVSTDVGQIAAVLDQQRCGFLTTFECLNMAQILQNLMDDSALQKKMGMMAKKTIEEQYSVHNQLNTICDIYRELINHG